MKESTKPKLKMVGEDGNVFAILARAQQSAKQAGWSKEKIKEFVDEATSGDYDNALQTCLKYFDVN
jgi:hypothetical protein